MRKTGICLLIFFGVGLLAKAQQAPIQNWKELAAALDSLGRDSTLTDSGRLRVHLIAKAYKGLVQKMRDSAEAVRKAAKSKDSVLVKRVAVLGGVDLALVKRGVDSPVRRRVALPGRDRVKEKPLPPGSQSLWQAGWLLYMGVLVLLAGGLGWWWFRLWRRRKTAVQVGEAVVSEVAGVADVSEVAEIADVPAEVVAGEKAVVGGKAGFICEMMMTAGPRKKFMNEENADKDLGEDVCGCVIRGDKAGLWLLDGTSDQYCLKHPLTGKEYFSSRLLAQGIGDRLREAFTSDGGDGNALDGMMAEAIEGVRTDWVRGFRELPEEERILLKDNIKDKNCPECASTLLSAVLSLDGGLWAYRSGDSKMLTFRSEAGGDFSGSLIPLVSSFTTKNAESNDRIFFRMVLDKAGELDILCNKPGYEVLRQEKINTLIAFSDGIGPVTEEVLQKEYGEDPIVVRRRIVTDSQGTADDKSICFIRIKEDN